MLMTAAQLKTLLPQHAPLSNVEITRKLSAIETTIRQYTHNKFQLVTARFTGQSHLSVISGHNELLQVGDTVEISGDVNKCLCVIQSITQNDITVDLPLLPWPTNLVTKISYPSDVIQCALDLFDWSQKYKNKIGIKSESLSRHSVSYEDSSGGLFGGFPVAILSGLNLYKKARF